MSKSFFRILTITIWSLFAGPPAFAQSELPKFEISPVVTLSRQAQSIELIHVISGPGLISSSYNSFIGINNGITDMGKGIRLTYNLNKHIAAEAEFLHFSRDLKDSPGDSSVHDRFQGVFGIKAGRRFEKIGIFAKARPGLIRFNRTSSVVVLPLCSSITSPIDPAVNCRLAPPMPLPGTTNFAFDVGGALEIYTSRRTLIRFDFGDTITHDGLIRGAKGERGALHRLNIGLGFGFRF